MTKLLEQGIEAVKAMPADRQDQVGEMLLWLAGQERFEPTPEQLEELRIGLAEADRGEFATDKEMAATWKKFGL